MKKLVFVLSLILLLYILINSSFILSSINAKVILKKLDIGETIKTEDKKFVSNYVRKITETRVRGCTTSSKILFLSCNKSFSEWVLGKEKSTQLDEYLNNSYKENFWLKTYNITNLDVLNQRIENLKNEKFRYDDVYKNQEKYFYDCNIVQVQDNYELKFIVWKRDNKCEDSEIIYGLKDIIVKAVLLKEESFRKNIKVRIELYSGSEGDDLEKVLFDGYVI